MGGYIGNSVVGVEHPSTSALNATTGAFTGAVTADAGVVVDNITIDGTEIDLSSGDLTLDVAGDLIFDADDGAFIYKDGGVEIFRIGNSSSSPALVSAVSDKDIIFKGNDGGSTITALTLDMSAAGTAAFNAGATFADGCTITTADNDPQLTLVSTDADATQGPVLKFYRNSASPADNDLIGQLLFHGEDGAGNDQQYANIQSIITNNAHNNESSSLNISTIKGGSVEQSVKFGATETVFNESSLDLDFRVESDNNASALFVQGSDGNVGIFTQAPDARLEIHDGGATSNTQLLQIHSDSSSFSSQLISIFAERNTTNSTFNAIRYYNTGASANRFIVRDSGNVENTNNSYGAISDETVKKNITNAASQWDDIKALTVRKFHLNEQDDTDPKMIGVVAQEIEKVSDGLVTTAYDEGEERDIKTVKYSVLYMKAVKALQEAMTRIETLEAKVTALENA